MPFKSMRGDYYDILWVMGDSFPEDESKEEHGVRNPMPRLTITSPYIQSRVDSNTFTIKYCLRKLVEI